MKKIWYYTFILFALFMAGCEDTDKLEADINSLKERVAALESKVEMLNGNIKALNILCQDGMIISKVEHDAEQSVYTLTLSDGTKLKLAERTDSFANVPLVNISSEGYWQVSYNNGQTYVTILHGDTPINAVGKDGYTPEFRINAEGNWEVSTTGDSNYTVVKDENGNPVAAVYDASSSSVNLFQSVTEENGVLKITFDGSNKVVEVPVVPDFECYFKDIAGEQKINPDETKKFEVYIKGADKTIITAPMGWKATLGTPNAQNIAELTVIAPKGKVVTRAVADNTRDISILAFKGTFATLAKMQVNLIEVETGGGDEPTPVPGILTELVVPLTATTSLTAKGKYNSKNLLPNDEGDYWFTRFDVEGAYSSYEVDVTDLAVKAIIGDGNVGWNLTAFGYHKTGVFDKTATYVLTFNVKASVAGSIGAMIRTCDDKRAFKVANTDKKATILTSNVSKDLYNEISIQFDFTHTHGTAGVNISDDKGLFEGTLDADVQGINIYFYNNKKGTTLYIKDIKLVKL